MSNFEGEESLDSRSALSGSGSSRSSLEGEDDEASRGPVEAQVYEATAQSDEEFGSDDDKDDSDDDESDKDTAVVARVHDMDEDDEESDRDDGVVAHVQNSGVESDDSVSSMPHPAPVKVRISTKGLSNYKVSSASKSQSRSSDVSSDGENEEDGDDDDDDESRDEVVAVVEAVNSDEDDEDNSDDANSVVHPVILENSDKKSVSSKIDEDDDEGAEPIAVAVIEETSTKHPKKKQKNTDASDSTNMNDYKNLTLLPFEKVRAAFQARAVLLQQIQEVPVTIGKDNVSVHSFGKVKVELENIAPYFENTSYSSMIPKDGIPKVEPSDGNTPPIRESKYSSAAGIHPVGFSCIRSEFSPVHGRFIKLKCDILDGTVLHPQKKSNKSKRKKKSKKKKRKYKHDSNSSSSSDSSSSSSSSSSEDESIEEQQLEDPGPLFRISWGKGVDEMEENGAVYIKRFDPYTRSHYIENDEDSDSSSMSMSPTEAIVKKSALPAYSQKPEVGMRCKVRFDADWYGGTILKVAKTKKMESHSNKKKGKKTKKVVQNYKIKIEYDDGTTEEEIFPDPEIELTLPTPPTIPPYMRDNVMLKEGNRPATLLGLLSKTSTKGTIKSKPVTVVMGKSILEAWGKTLLCLGLIDESMMEEGFLALKEARQEGMAEAKGKIEALKLQRKQARARQLQRQSDASANNNEMKDKEDEKSDDEQATEREEYTEEELHLKAQVDELRSRYASLKEDAAISSNSLSDSRLASIGPFLCNPFNSLESESQQVTWLANIIRKEKVKMGSTGNKRKIVTATDLLEKMDSYFNSEIERLVEGLPGSEYCPSYVFQSCRAGGASAANQAWVHEARIRHEKEREKEIKAVKEAKEKESQLREKEIKRKEREEERESRKRAKVEETEKKKKEREEERLSRLSIQVDERLFKEACFQREKVIQLAAKSLGKEYNRRRKAAEIVSSHRVEHGLATGEDKDFYIMKEEALTTILPPNHKKIHEDVLRIWDFIHSFGAVFKKWFDHTSLPTLKELQSAIDKLQVLPPTGVKIKEIELLNQIGLMFCKPLSTSVVKILSTVLATNLPIQQKSDASIGDAASVASSSSTGSKSSQTTFPVDLTTWREVAKLSLSCDALMELNFSKQDCAHILRGFRSAGHPNSKEAKRLRKGEDYILVLLRQSVLRKAEVEAFTKNGKEEKKDEAKITISVPSTASCDHTSWIFYLHNINVSSITSSAIRSNIREAMKLLKNEKSTSVQRSSNDSYIESLNRALVLMDPASENVTKAKQIVLQLLNRTTGEIFSNISQQHIVYKTTEDLGIKKKEEIVLPQPSKPSLHKKVRQRMGLIQSIILSDDEYKAAIAARQKYIVNAVREKEEREKKEHREKKTSRTNNGEEDDDDDDDDDEDEEEDEIRNSNEEKKVAMEEKQTDKPNLETDSETKDTKETEKIKIGKITIFDGFSGDDPMAPELIRRCLAVLRTLCGTIPAENFVYPVDPQDNPRYYEYVLRPMSLFDVGKMLQNAGKRLSIQSTSESGSKESEIESVVAAFARNVRLIAKNCSCFCSVGAAPISSAQQMLRIFERLLLDWVLAPKDKITPLGDLDDDRCVEFHESDDESLVLLCDGCEGKFNMGRLDPPITDVPKGDWYCPRCLSGRSWSHLDPRVGQAIHKNLNGKEFSGVISNCSFQFIPKNDFRPTLAYEILYDHDGDREHWTLDEVNSFLQTKGTTFPRIECLEAVSESAGYGSLSNDEEILPIQLNPTISDTAAQAARASSVFRDSIISIVTLSLSESNEMNSTEWMRLLKLMSTKCAISDDLQDFMHGIENKAAEKLSSEMALISKIKNIEEILPKVTDDEEDSVESLHAENEKVKSGPDTNSQSDEEEWNEIQSNDGRPTEVMIPNFQNKKSILEEVGSKSQSNGSTTALDSVPDVVLSKEDSLKKERLDLLSAKSARMKAREDSYVGYALQKQMEPIAAAFEEDAMSDVIQSALSKQPSGLDLKSSMCPETKCDFSGLFDTSLGGPLVRIPNKQEWCEMMKFAYSNRPFQLLAVMHVTKETDTKIQDSQANSINGVLPQVETSTNIEESLPSENTQEKRLISVKIRVGGELVAGEEDKSLFRELPNQGMLEFLPLNKEGFASELNFRDSSNLPFVTGSLSAHECCAIAVHNARVEKMLQLHKESYTIKAERDCSRLCGRTQPLGIDDLGRSYWMFQSDPSSLFVYKPQAGMKINKDSIEKEWYQFDKTDSIAVIIAYLKGKEPVDEIRRLFPKAAKVSDRANWDEFCYKQFNYPKLELSNVENEPTRSANEESGSHLSEKENDNASKSKNEGEMDEDEPFEEGEDVLVESKSGKILWDAKVMVVAQDPNTHKVNGYRVHYLYWSSRFDEWVEPFRVVEPNENNLIVQEDLLEDILTTREGYPEPLNELNATNYLLTDDRSRGPNCPLPKSKKILAEVGPGAAPQEKYFALLKAAILIIESALPVGAVDVNTKGSWNPAFATSWRSFVEETKDPVTLMGCLVMLEDAISEKWMTSLPFHLLSCLPRHWKAVSDANVSSLSLRIKLLDSALKYDYVNKSRKGSSNKRRK